MIKRIPFLHTVWVAVLAICFFPFLGHATTSLDHFDFSSITSPKVGYVPFRIIINARAANNTLVRSFSGTVTLSAMGDNGPIPVEASAPLRFTNGQWVGTISFNTTESTTVTLTVADSSNHRGTAGPIVLLAPTFRIVDEPIISLVSDRSRGVLYGSLGLPSPFFGRIAIIDPASGLIQNTIPVNGGAGRLELARDDTVLYVVTDGGLHIRRLRLPDFTEELLLDLGDSEPGAPNYVDDIAIAPDRPEVIAVSKERRNLSPRFSGLSVYDNGTEKKAVGLFTEANAVAFGNNAEVLYAFNNETTGYELTRFAVGQTNLQIVSSRRGLITGFGARLHFQDGILYATTGRMIDPETYTLLGEIPNGDPAALMLPLPAVGRIVYMSPAALGSLFIHDKQTLRLFATIPFPAPRRDVSGLVAWAENGLAFHDGSRLYFLESEFLPSDSPADLEVTPVTTKTGPVDVGADTTMEVAIRNLGPNTANSVLVLVDGPSDTVLTAADAGTAAVAITDRQVRCELPSLAPGASFNLRFTAHANLAAWHPFVVTAISRAVDQNGTNNSASVVLTAATLGQPESFVLFKIPTRDLVFDPVHKKLLASGAATAGPFAHSIVSINPATTEVSQPVFVGNRPSQLAVSDDGQFLYVAFEGLAEIRRFRLPGITHDLTIPLGIDGFFGARFGFDLEVRPGNPAEVVVARSTSNTSSTSEGLVYFRDGTLISEGLGDGTVDYVAFPAPNKLYAFGDSFGLLRVDVTETGLQSLGFRSISEFNPAGFTAGTGRIYFGSGTIFDAETGQSAGQFNGLSISSAPPYVDESTKRALFVERGFTNSTIAAYDLMTLVRTGSLSLPGVTGTASSIRRWAADGIALRAGSGVAILRTTLAGISEQPPRFDGITVTVGTITIQFTAPTPGQYQLEYTPSLGAAWSPQGAPFSESTTPLQIPRPGVNGFFRISRLP